MVRVQKSVNAFRIDRIVFEINLTNDKQNNVVHILTNDHFKRRDEFCGKVKSISIRPRGRKMAHIAEARNNFSLHRICGSPLNRGKTMIQSFELFPSEICAFRSASCGGKMESTFRDTGFRKNYFVWRLGY